MTAPPGPTPSRRSRFWKESPERAWPLALFAVLFVHGATFGLSDDEAYYWVLARKPALAYAFHPPMVGWAVAVSRALIGWLFGGASSAVVRLPSALCAAGVLALALRWLGAAGVPRERLGGSARILLSVAGLFALAWMMVPDLPLLLGWMIAFHATWKMIAERKEAGPWLALGVALAILSKYSGVLVAGSAGLCFLFWGRDRLVKGWAWIVLGALAGALPPLLWNASHEWLSILYQIRDRHEGASISLVRYARFWLIEAFAVGPCLLAFSFLAWRRAPKPVLYAGVWALPAALIFCTQPLWADFKPHWALVVWWPMALALAWYAANGRFTRLARAQAIYGLTLGALVLFACRVPIGDWILARTKGESYDPRLDVTNDFYGWSGLPLFLAGKGALGIPVIGSRYQTAAQAAFALGDRARVTLLPRDRKAMDEWPDLGVSAGQGPDWPRLTEPVYFVADNRYDEGPLFPGATCTPLGSFEGRRGAYLAKTIRVWRCVPGT